MRRVLLSHGLDISLDDCKRIWALYSDSNAVEWCDLPVTDEKLWKILSDNIVDALMPSE